MFVKQTNGVIRAEINRQAKILRADNRVLHFSTQPGFCLQALHSKFWMHQMSGFDKWRLFPTDYLERLTQNCQAFRWLECATIHEYTKIMWAFCFNLCSSFFNLRPLLTVSRTTHFSHFFYYYLYFSKLHYKV